MAGVGGLEVSDATFDQEVLQQRAAGTRGFLGSLVRAMPGDRAHRGWSCAMRMQASSRSRRWMSTAMLLRPLAMASAGSRTLLFFKGGKVADQVVGYVPQDVIEEKVQRLLA